MKSSLKFLVTLCNGVAVDPTKIEVISKMSKGDLMEDNDCTSFVKRIKSFVGMVFYYHILS